MAHWEHSEFHSCDSKYLHHRHIGEDEVGRPLSTTADPTSDQIRSNHIDVVVVAPRGPPVAVTIREPSCELGEGRWLLPVAEVTVGYER